MLPLEGIRVADFSGHASGPLCAQMLGDFGAEVIKIEPPRGDHARKWGSARYGANDEFSSEFLALNRNKESVVVDLKKPEGLDVAKAIIRKSDVLLENFKPGLMKEFSLDYESVAAFRPEIVYCSISAFGQTGPFSPRPGFDMLMQAYAGPLSITGEKGRPAVRIGPSTIDFMSGAHGAFGILAALRERDHSGRGQQVDTSLYESAIVQMTHLMVDYTGTGHLPERHGPHFPFLAPYGIFLAKDREFYIGVSMEGMWTRFCKTAGWDDLLEDPRFKDNAHRTRNQKELYEILIPRIRERPAAEWVAMALELQIPHSLINDLSEVVNQEQALAREAVVPIEGIPKVRAAGIPIKLSRTPGQVRRPPPSLGAATTDVLTRLGFAASEIERLRALGAIR